MKRFANTLGRVRVAAPCEENWDEMRGDDRVRFCARCSQNVYNLSAMTRGEAERLVVGNEGRICVRFYRRKDGTILTRNCPAGLIKLRRRVSRVATATAAAAISFLAGVGVAPTTEQAAAAAADAVTVAAEVPVVLPARAADGEVEDFAVAGLLGTDMISDGPYIPGAFIGFVSFVFGYPLLKLRERRERLRSEGQRIWSNGWERSDESSALPREGSAVDPNQ
jgi:hypothetical protein